MPGPLATEFKLELVDDYESRDVSEWFCFAPGGKPFTGREALECYHHKCEIPETILST